MKFPSAIAEIVSEFSGFHHMHPSQSTTSFASISSATSQDRKMSNASESSHSLHITVGASDVPTVPPPPHVHFVKKSSSPTFSRVASTSSLHEKVMKLKRTASSDSEHAFSARKVSTSSYRVVH